MMRVLVAHVYHESNTFCLEKTRLEDFEIREGADMLPYLPGVDVLEDAGIEVVPSVYAQRWSSGTVEARALLYFEEKILQVLRREKGRLDGLYLSLHGGMTVDQLGSGEYHLLRAVRQEIGDDLPIAVSLDMHANVQDGLGDMCNVLTGYHTAPHTDAAETQRKAAAGLVELLKSGRLPHPQIVRVPMLLVGERALSKDEPLHTIYDRCKDLEAEERILAATLYVGMAWGDTPNTTVTVAVSPAAPEDAEYALEQAKILAQTIFSRRDECPYAHPSYMPEEAVRRALASKNAPLYLSDSGDNPTAGGVGDSTLLLKLMLAQQTGKRVLFAPIYDGGTFRALNGHAVGEWLHVEIGSGREPYCAPVGVDAEIVHFCHIQAYHGLTLENVADGVLLRCSTIDVILTDTQMAFTGPECFESAGVRVEDYDVVVLKMGYMFAEIAAPCRENIMAFTPGCTPLLITADQYHRLPRPIWPLDADAELSL